MADTYKIDSKEQLIDMVNEELDVLNSIFDGEGVVVTTTTETPISESDAST